MLDNLPNYQLHLPYGLLICLIGVLMSQVPELGPELCMYPRLKCSSDGAAVANAPELGGHAHVLNEVQRRRSRSIYEHHLYRSQLRRLLPLFPRLFLSSRP
jgi:hypothetical protein